MDRHDRASGSHDRGRAQITQIRTHTTGTLTRQSAVPNGGYFTWVGCAGVAGIRAATAVAGSG
jgi:hypothetical protein